MDHTTPPGNPKPVFDAREREATRELLDKPQGAGSIRRTPADSARARGTVTAQVMGDPAPGRFPWN